MTKQNIYRNRIDAAIGITSLLLTEIRSTSSLTRQRTKQRRRWHAHLARKNT